MEAIWLAAKSVYKITRRSCNSCELGQMGLVRITSWYPKFNGSHFGLPPSEIHRMTGLPQSCELWRMRTSPTPTVPINEEEELVGHDRITIGEGFLDICLGAHFMTNIWKYPGLNHTYSASSTNIWKYPGLNHTYSASSTIWSESQCLTVCLSGITAVTFTYPLDMVRARLGFSSEYSLMPCWHIKGPTYCMYWAIFYKLFTICCRNMLEQHNQAFCSVCVDHACHLWLLLVTTQVSLKQKKKKKKARSFSNSLGLD